MTQVTNVMFIILITISMSIVAAILTYLFDIFIDVHSLVKSIPHLILSDHIQNMVVS